MIDVYYRCEVSMFWKPKFFNDGSLDTVGENENIYFQKIGVEKVTPRGVRLRNGKFVAHHWRKRYAYPTKVEAFANFKARRARQIALLTAQLARAQDELKLAEKYDISSADAVSEQDFYCA